MRSETKAKARAFFAELADRGKRLRLPADLKLDFARVADPAT